ncbi:hypothetical protein H072_2972 [Dactylellina haptotyla CBS 200.50]|uniref:ribonuclease T1 n=1 Tax=Dactylellina haptotyla (strain CBS 200.50) TaxID=1284197 RepID=S8AJA0_DACHA|nr:hypothetical protein H072_2972 [Dactylellina haptotyla CBS 200.50]
MKSLSVPIFLSLLLAPVVFSKVQGVTEINCGGKAWNLDQVQSASDESLGHVNDGSTVGNNNYPHKFNNREGFDFSKECTEPFYEFPIVKGGDYDGGPPNTDRVVIGTVKGGSAFFCGAITHTGAEGNNFKECHDRGNKTIPVVGKRIMRRGIRLPLA